MNIATMSHAELAQAALRTFARPAAHVQTVATVPVTVSAEPSALHIGSHAEPMTAQEALAALLNGKTVSTSRGFASYINSGRFQIMPLDARASFTVQTANAALLALRDL